MRVSAHGASNPGRRASNEDALLVDPALGLFVVADGMGGHKAGEVAARLAIDTIHEFILRSCGVASDVTWPYGLDPDLSLNGNRLRNALRLANVRVLEAANECPEHAGMGTTVVAALLEGDRISFVGVGDSRIYLWQRGEVRQLTQDDSWVATVLARDPAISESALAHHPMRHVLTSVVGARVDTDPRVTEQPFEIGDALLLCSDGLHGSVQVEEIASALGSTAVEDSCRTLVEGALAQGATDNVTAVVVRREA